MNKFFRHLLIWICWFGIHSISMYGLIPKLTKIQWVQFAYNIGSLIVSFYIVSFIATIFLKKFSLIRFNDSTVLEKISYILSKWSFWAILITIAAYVGLSIYLDDFLFGYKYPSLALHIDQRLSRVTPYAFVACGNSYFIYHSAKQKKRLEMSYLRIVKMQESNEAVKAIHREISEEMSARRKVNG